MLLVGLIAAVAVPSAVMASQSDTATVAKKKKTYCQRTGASVKAKLKGKSHEFYAFAEKGGYGILICQDKPKFTGGFSMTKGDKISTLRVTARKCAVLKVEGPTHNPQAFMFDFANFLSKNGQAAVYTAGYQQPTATIEQIVLSNNCVAAFAERVNGIPGIAVQGTGAFGYTGTNRPAVSASMTDKELAAVKISGSGASATVNWTEAGVPRTFTYVKPAGF